MLPAPDLESLAAIAVYAIVWSFIFAECGLFVGFLLPGDTVLFASGLVAAAPNSGVNIWLLCAGSLVAAVAGDQVGYHLGKRYGRSWALHRGEGRIAGHLNRAERFYTRFGLWAVVIARWIPWARTFVPGVAGAADMARGKFLVANVAGAIPWAVGVTLAGYGTATVAWVRGLSVALIVLSLLLVITGAVVFGVRTRRRGETSSAGDSDGPASFGGV